MLEKAMLFRKKNPKKDQFTDISYDLFIDHPLETIRLVYNRAGMIMDPKLEDILRTLEQKNRKSKYGSHHYRLSDFSLAKNIIRDHYSEYLKFVEEINIINPT
jgi:hypothetical protein